MRITVDLPESQIRRLEEVSRRLNVSAEALAAAAVQDMVARDDSEFARVAERILKKNADLYRRLA
jgi:predicted transcriptional regulator